MGRTPASTTTSSPIGKAWGDFVSWAQRFYAAEDFDRRERVYTLELAQLVADAREALVADRDWRPLLAHAFKASRSNLTH